MHAAVELILCIAVCMVGLVLFSLPLGLGLWCAYRLVNAHARGRRGTVCELVGCVGWFVVFGVIVTLLLPANIPWKAIRRSQCMNNMKQIMLAMRNYHDKYGCFPPAYTVDKSGRPLHSWRVLLLPFLQQKALYDRIRLDEPYNSPHNQGLFDTYTYWRPGSYRADAPTCLLCPADQENRADTNYVMILGPRSISNGPNCVRLKDITDGESKTIAVVETYDLGIRWYEPRDLRVVQMSFRINDPDYCSIASRHEGGFGGAQVVFVDEHVVYLSEETDPRVIEAMTTISGGEDVSQLLP